MKNGCFKSVAANERRATYADCAEQMMATPCANAAFSARRSQTGMPAMHTTAMNIYADRDTAFAVSFFVYLLVLDIIAFLHLLQILVVRLIGVGIDKSDTGIAESRMGCAA